MEKGQQPLHRLFILMTVTLIFAVFMFNPLQLAINEAMEGDAQIQTQRLASTINLLLTSPDLASYIIDTPRSKCKITITDSFVRLTMTPAAGQETYYTASIIKTNVKIIGGEFECKRNLQFIRSGNELRISAI